LASPPLLPPIPPSGPADDGRPGRRADADGLAGGTMLVSAAGIAAALLYLVVLLMTVRAIHRLQVPLDLSRRRAIADLERALEHNELCVHYQPKVEVASGRPVGVEALVRWEHPERGLLAPAEFLPLVESSPPLLVELTTQVLDAAISDCARWNREGRALSVAVNIAAPSLLEGPLADTVRALLAAHGLVPQKLILEVTESAIMQTRDDVRLHLAELQKIGVALSIDDFGTGHSSLARLSALPFDELKLDRCFVGTACTDRRAHVVARLIVDLAHNLDAEVVAEGIEDEQALRLVAGLGCGLAQGYHFARPLPAERLCDWLDEHSSFSTEAAVTRRAEA